MPPVDATTPTAKSPGSEDSETSGIDVVRAFPEGDVADEVVAEREPQELEARMQVELAEDARLMRVDGLGADGKLLADLHVRLPAREHLEDLALARREHRQRSRRLRRSWAPSQE